ncbi:MAG: glucose-6-phosphate isomerase [Candidatus Bipolaricaulia bacterium]
MLRLTNAPRTLPDILSRMKREFILSRIWAHDHTVWQDDPTEITDRLGWLHLPETMPKHLGEIEQFVSRVRADDFRHVLLLGMGGSILAPETFSLTFGHANGYPDLTILDSTHPDAVLQIEQELDLKQTLFIVATKSGTTTETLSLFRYFHQRAEVICGRAEAGRRFVAITDPGSPLLGLASRHEFREVFENDPTLGGRYSAVSLFGLVPAALLGVDIRGLLRHAQEVSRTCTDETNLEATPAAQLGALLGGSAREGRDKATLVLSDEIASFGNWLEQLIAESTGKCGVGILPIVDEPVGPPDVYGADRVFLHLRLDGDTSQDAVVEALASAGPPVARVDLPDRLALGGQFFLWELATAIAGHILKINPFDQPNVEAAKTLARELVKGYERTGSLPHLTSEEPQPNAVNRFLDDSSPGDYIALQAYLPPSLDVAGGLSELRTAIRDQSGLATTVGFGPRFLHSTGQLHKGDRGNGLFIQFVVDPERDVQIPSEASAETSTLTFGTLIAAQSGGDRRALFDAGRRVLTIRLDRESVADQLQELARGLS